MRRPGAQRQSRNRRNTRQRLTAKTQRGDGFKVIQTRYLAGRVARQRQFDLVLIDALAIVPDTHQLLATGYDVNLNGLRARVETVFDQLLDDRSRPLNDLAGGNLINQMIWELLNGHANLTKQWQSAIFPNPRANVLLSNLAAGKNRNV
jgi:hypothetical protein